MNLKKAYSLFNLISQKPNINKIYLYAKNPYEAKYQFLINKWESKDLKYFNHSKDFIEYSNYVHDICKNIEKYNPSKKCKVLIVFDDKIADMLSNKKLNSIVTKLFIRGRKLNISLVFITQSYFAVSKNIRVNSTHFLLWKFQANKNFSRLHLLIHYIFTFKTLNLYKKCTAKPYSCLVIDSTLPSDSSLHFRKNLLEKI